jgi:murein DD-endopeptidase MepM/ murein hydrolase activator NlpD
MSQRTPAPVRAVISGKIVKLFLSKPGGNTIYLVDKPEIYCEGALVKAGDVIGDVGSTGDASPQAPHLHCEISRLGPEKHWWGGTPQKPFPSLTEASRRESRALP